MREELSGDWGYGGALRAKEETRREVRNLKFSVYNSKTDNPHIIPPVCELTFCGKDVFIS